MNRKNTIKQSNQQCPLLLTSFLLLPLLGSTSCVQIYTPIGGSSPTVSTGEMEVAGRTILSQRLKSKTTLIIDARSPVEFYENHYTGAINVPHDEPTIDTSVLGSNKDIPILVYCRSGKRAELLRKRLLDLGYSNTVNGGGLSELQNE